MHAPACARGEPAGASTTRRAGCGTPSALPRAPHPPALLRRPLPLLLRLLPLLLLLRPAGATSIAVPDPLNGSNTVLRLGDNRGNQYYSANNSAGVSAGFTSALCPAGTTFARYQCSNTGSWSNNPAGHSQGASCTLRAFALQCAHTCCTCASSDAVTRPRRVPRAQARGHSIIT
jgi:hypothetical protein